MKIHIPFLAPLAFLLIFILAPLGARAQRTTQSPADSQLTSPLPNFGGSVDTPSDDDTTWYRGQTYKVEWSGFDGDKVVIKLYKGLKLKKTRTTDNDGETDWTVDTNFETGSDYRFMIVSNDNPFEFAWSENEFSIASGTRKVVYPSDSGITWKRGGTYNVRWEGFRGDNVKIELYLGPLVVETRTTANDGQTDWTVDDELIDASNYKIRISEDDDSTHDDWSNNTFKIKGSTAKVDSPNSSGITWKRGKKYPVKWEGFSGDRVRIELWKGNAPVDWEEVDNDGSADWTVSSSAAKSSDYKIRIQSIDRPAQFDFSDKTFKIQ